MMSSRAGRSAPRFVVLFACLLAFGGALLGLISQRAAAATPTAVTDPATIANVNDCETDESYTVTLNGTVDPGGLDTGWYFQYGPSSAYGSQTATQDGGAGTSAEPVASTLTNVYLAIDRW